MEGEGMVAVVRGLRDAGLAVTLLDGSRQYTLLPNSITQPAAPQRAPVTNANAATQQSPPKFTADSSTESSAPLCDRDAQAIDGRYASMYKTVHCHVRPTSPPVQLTEFPPQRPDHYPGHGHFQVGGAGSGATYSHIRASSPVTSFRGGMSWPDRGSVCTPRPSHEVDAFANSLRKYPCLSPDRSSEVMERLINYTQAKGLSKTFTRNPSSPSRIPEPTSYHTLEAKGTYTRTPRSYEPEVTVRSKRVEDPPTRDRKKDEHHESRPMRSFDVRCIRDMSKRMRDSVKAYSSYPYTHPVCPTIKENHDYQPFSYDYQNSTNSVNMEIQAAVKMISKEVATVQREHLTRKTVAVPESPTSSAGEDNVEGECYFVPNLDISTSFKSIQTNFCPSDITLKPRKSAQTVFSTIDFHSRRDKTLIGRKSKSQEQIKVTKDELKRSLLELIEEVSNCSKSKKIIRDELIKKLFVTDRDDNKGDRGKIKREKCHKYASTFCPTACDYVGDFHELVGKLKHCYGDTKHVLRSEITPFRISEYRQLDFVLRDWINNLNLKTRDISRYMDRNEILNSVEDRIKELFKSMTKQDFDLKSGIVKIIEEIPIEVNKSYNSSSYLLKLVDVLLKRMKNVIVNQQNARIRRRPNVNRSRKILTEGDIRDFVRTHLLDFFNECNLEMCDDTLDDLENEILDVLIDSIDCIRCGHVDDAMEEMDLILQDIGQMTEKQANYISNIILQDLQEMLNNCNFHQTYMILNVNNNSGRLTNKSNNTDVSIGAITDEDLRANLDHYTNQLCQRINEWLDTLNIPQIQDRGFREVVVNDLAGDIVDRHKYIEINNTYKSTEEDELEALKYQIFKWINKLVGDDNQETIGNARSLMEKINSVPVPMLTNPKHRKINNTGDTGETLDQTFDPMRPCLGETGPNTCSEENQKLMSSKQPCCMKDNKVIECPATGTCCKKDTCPNAAKSAQGISRIHSQTAQGIPEQPGSSPYTDPVAEGSNDDGPKSFAMPHRPSQDQSSPNPRLSNADQYGYIPPGSFGQSFQSVENSLSPQIQGDGFSPAQVPYGQVVQVGPGRTSFVPSGIPSQQGSGRTNFAPSGTPSQQGSGRTSFSSSGTPSQQGAGRTSYAPSGTPSQQGPGRVTYAPPGTPSQQGAGRTSYAPSGTPSQQGPGRVTYAPPGTPSQQGAGRTSFSSSGTPSQQGSGRNSFAPPGTPTQQGAGRTSLAPSGTPSQQGTVRTSFAPSGPPTQQGAGRTSFAPPGTPNQQGPGRTNFVPSEMASSKSFPTELGLGSPGSQTPYGTGNASPSERMSSSGGSFTPVGPNQQFMNEPSLHSVYGAEPGSMMSVRQGVQDPGFTEPTAGQMGRSSLGAGAGSPYLPFAQSPGSASPIPISVKKINEDFDDYLQQWVQQIPIAANTPAEEQAADKARLGIYNGVWKVVTKMEIDPEIFNNPHYYQDAFDDEVEGLMKSLPKSKELEEAKPVLKAQLFQKTLAMNEQIKSSTVPASYKQQLIENIENNLPKSTHTFNKEEKEELEKQNLVDYYILHTRYKDEDSVKANVHKKNFLKKLNEFLEKIKKRHNIADMDTNAYANEIINSLDKVPTPNAPAIREEADDILLGIEVDNWISDLPQKSDAVGPLEKRRVRDSIVKKIEELGNNVNYSDSSFVTPLKAEMPKYLEKIPLKQGTNVDFMVDELANRVKNLSKFVRPKSVSFQEPRNYEEFSRDMPAASSFLGSSEHDGSYFGDNIVRDAGPKTWIGENTLAPQDAQWHSMQTTQVPSDLRNWSDGPQNISQPYVQNIPGQMPIVGNYSAGGYGVQSQFPSNFHGQIPFNGQSQFSPATQGQYNPNIQAQYNPNTQGQFSPNNQAQFSPIGQIQFCPNVKAGLPEGHLCAGGPCCANPACTNRSQSLGPFSQSATQGLGVGGPYGQGFSTAQSSPIPYSQDLTSGNAYGPGILDGKFSNTVRTSQSPQGFYDQGRPSLYNQSFGPTPTPFGPVSQNIQDNSLPGHIQSQGQFARYSGQVPQRSYAEVFPQDGLMTANQRYSQGPYTRVSGQIPQETFGQGFSIVQDTSLPGNLMQSQRPHANLPGQVPQGPFSQGFQNVQDGSVPGYQTYSQGPTAGHPGQIPQEPFGQGFPNVHDGSLPDRSMPGNQMYSQGPRSSLPGQALQEPFGQGYQNLQAGSGPRSQILTQGPNARVSGQILQEPFGQGLQNIDGCPIPASQMHPQGPNAGRLSQSSRGPYGQSFPSTQSPGSVPYNQDQNFGSGAYSQGAQSVRNGVPVNLQPSQGPYSQTLSSQGQVQSIAPYSNNQSYEPVSPRGEVSPSDRRSSVPASRKSYQGPSATQSGNAYQGTNGKTLPNTQDDLTRSGQASPYDIADNKGQGYSGEQPNASTEVQSSMHSPTLNQTAQSSGPVSAASQVPDSNKDDQSQKPYMQEMADGAMGILGISQEPGPSTRSDSLQAGKDQAGSGQTSPSQTRRSLQVSGAQRPSTATKDTTHPGFYKSTDSKGIRHTIDHNKSLQQSMTDECPQSICIPVPCAGQPISCSTPHQQMNRGGHRSAKKSREQRLSADGALSSRRKSEMDETDTSTDKERERCRCMRRGRRCRTRKQPEDCQVEYRPCIPVMRYPCYY